MSAAEIAAKLTEEQRKIIRSRAAVGGYLEPPRAFNLPMCGLVKRCGGPWWGLTHLGLAVRAELENHNEG